MPFRFSELSIRGKSGGDSNNDSDRFEAEEISVPVPSSRPVTAGASSYYDNGTSRLHASLVQGQGQGPPSYVQTTEQLADFIRSRDTSHNGASAAYLPARSSSLYSTDCSSAATFYHHAPDSYERLRLRPAAAVDPVMVAGIRHRYVARPVGRILPGATRTHRYQGFWLERGTTRKTESDKKFAKKSSTKKNGRKVNQEDRSGWYDN